MIKVMKQNIDGSLVVEPTKGERFVLLRHYQLIFLCSGAHSNVREDITGNFYERNLNSI